MASRIVVIGSSCSGKTTLAKKLSRNLKINHIELDELHWKPNWQEREDDDFRKLVVEALESEEWVLDGNYAIVRDLVWTKATMIIWLNYSFSLVLFRSIKRSVLRVISRRKLFAGNAESFRRAFMSKESIIWWVIKTFHDKKRRYPVLLKTDIAKPAQIVELKNPSQAKQKPF